ncbi:glycosyltransferase family 25 protein [Xenorhabdus bovienii]|uniref:glycosyltransferase family 25 protein n=1 Tax=Xenorhabdus bovienii TaxID=40576 RepID=UPI0023B2714E|nr:glycosyltransferase family 25 protein [Xenorhabdus bovienii]MDE9435338.1 glycosyltransferase family 25 protein [Xenorhabdus bovienii]MDE9497148.1 glycosyltransferase family 25 protein [Xenorhabdus bovienii]
MKSFVINLEKDIKRKQSIQKQLNSINLDAEFINAVYGKALSAEQLNKFCPDFNQISLTLGEVGCSLSHLDTYKKIIDGKTSIALILEDDAKFDEKLIEVLSSLESHPMALSSTPYVFLLNKTNEYFDSFKKPLTRNYHIVDVIDAACAHGYILNLAAAKKLYEYLLPVRFVADEWKMLKEQNVIKLRAIIPSIIDISPNSLDSSIGNREYSLTELDKENRKRPISTKLKLALWRIFIRTWFRKIRP